MKLAAEVTVPADAFLLGSVLPETPVTVEAAQLVPAHDPTLPFLWVSGTPDGLDDFEAAAADADEVADLSLLVDRGGAEPAGGDPADSDRSGRTPGLGEITAEDRTRESDAGGDQTGSGGGRASSPGGVAEHTRLYEVSWDVDPALLETMDETGVHLRRAVGWDERWRLTLFAPEQSNLSAFGSAAAERSIPVTLERLTRPRPPTGGPVDVLTRTQREALQTAHEAGYFEVPRAVTLEELGQQLGVSRQAASSLLRRGTQALLEATFADRPSRLDRADDGDGDRNG